MTNYNETSKSKNIFEEKFDNSKPFNVSGSYSSKLKTQINGMPATFNRYTTEYGKPGTIADPRFCKWITHRHREIDNLYGKYFGIVIHVHFVRSIDIMILLFDGYQHIPQILRSYEGTIYFPTVNNALYLKDFEYEENIDEILSPNGCAMNYDGLLIGLYEMTEGKDTHRYWNYIKPNFNKDHRMDFISFLLRDQYAELQWN